MVIQAEHYNCISLLEDVAGRGEGGWSGARATHNSKRIVDYICEQGIRSQMEAEHAVQATGNVM